MCDYTLRECYEVQKKTTYRKKLLLTRMNHVDLSWTHCLPFQIAPYASVIINGVYWDARTPRLITIPDAKHLLTPVRKVGPC